MASVPEPHPDDESPPQGISLDELTEAFAEVMGAAPARSDRRGAAFETEAEATDAAGDEEPADVVAPAEPMPEASDVPAQDPCELCPRTILEAMLFVGNRDGAPLSAHRAAELMRDVEPEEIASLVEELNRRYTEARCPYRVVEEEGGYRLLLRKAYHRLRDRFYGRVREARLSQAAIDVLAAVAYQQPLTAEEVGQIRGKPSGSLLSQLVRRGLLRIERRDPKRRTPSYFTTDRFLELFDLESLDDLPQSEDLQRQ